MKDITTPSTSLYFTPSSKKNGRVDLLKRVARQLAETSFNESSDRCFSEKKVRVASQTLLYI